MSARSCGLGCRLVVLFGVGLCGSGSSGFNCGVEWPPTPCEARTDENTVVVVVVCVRSYKGVV